MKKLISPGNSFIGSPSTVDGTSQQYLSNQLARVIAINLMCLVVFSAFCALVTFGSLSLLLTFWNEHRASSVILIMIAIVSIPSAIEIAVSRLEFWQR